MSVSRSNAFSRVIRICSAIKNRLGGFSSADSGTSVESSAKSAWSSPSVSRSWSKTEWKVSVLSVSEGTGVGVWWSEWGVSLVVVKPESVIVGACCCRGEEANCTESERWWAHGAKHVYRRVSSWDFYTLTCSHPCLWPLSHSLPSNEPSSMLPWAITPLEKDRKGTIT